MTNLTLFFWMLPITVAVIAAMFLVISQLEQNRGTAQIAAIGFGTAFVAILLDTQRQYLPWWAFSLAVPLHWMVLVCILDAFLLRHGDRMPRRLLLPLVIAGSSVNFGFTFIVNDAAVRVPSASIVCTIIMMVGATRLIQYRSRWLDRAIACVISANLVCYTVRTILWFYLNQYPAYLRNSTFSDYMTMFYFTSGIALFATALLIMLTIITDIIARNQIEATMDSLTGVLNRRGFDHIVSESAKPGAALGAVIAIDLDEFKVINDRFGHAGGDQALVAVADILRSHCQHFGAVARMGGEEFLVLIKRSHAEAAKTLAETLRVAIGGLRLPGFPIDFRMTASIGIAHLSDHGPVESACREADIALYVAKGSGRNRVVCSDQVKTQNAFADSSQ